MTCVADRLAQYDRTGQRSQLHFYEPEKSGHQEVFTDDSEPRNMVPFVGNGLLGVSLDGAEDGRLRVALGGINATSLDTLTPVEIF